MSKHRFLLALALIPAIQPAFAEDIRIAVASNFSQAAQRLAERFEEISPHRVILVPGSTGKHYAQIRNGAPFDAFLAADVERPRRLEEEGLAVPGSRFTYAQGRLVLWSPRGEMVDDRGRVLSNGEYRFLAFANPDLAPYGRAAQEVLEELGLIDRLADRIVRGENIGQTFQFVASSNAELGFVALSQLTLPDGSKRSGSLWVVPQEHYEPIAQQAVLLHDVAAAREFLDFLRDDEPQALIRQHGYTIP